MDVYTFIYDLIRLKVVLLQFVQVLKISEVDLVHNLNNDDVLN